MQRIAINPAGHDIPAKRVPLVRRWKSVVVVLSDSANGRRTVQMIHDVGNVAESVVRFAEAVVVSSGQQQRDRFRMTVSDKQIAVR